jgi:hypothetical protein
MSIVDDVDPWRTSCAQFLKKTAYCSTVLQYVIYMFMTDSKIVVFQTSEQVFAFLPEQNQ